MNLKKYVLALLASVVLLAGCMPTFDGAAFATATLQTLYKGDFVKYAELTGISTAEVSVYRSNWLDKQTSDFISAFGFDTTSDDTLSDATLTRIHTLLEKIYANAKYDVIKNTNGKIVVMISPIQIITNNYQEIQTYVNDFNAQNDTFEFTELTNEEYIDTYFDGLLSILENHIADQDYGQAVEVEVMIVKDENGLYTITNETLENINKNIIAWPAI